MCGTELTQACYLSAKPLFGSTQPRFIAVAVCHNLSGAHDSKAEILFCKTVPTNEKANIMGARRTNAKKKTKRRAHADSRKKARANVDSAALQGDRSSGRKESAASGGRAKRD